MSSLRITVATHTTGRGRNNFTVTGTRAKVVLVSGNYKSQKAASEAARRFCVWARKTNSLEHYLAGMRKALAAARFVPLTGTVGRILKSYTLEREFVAPRTSDWVKGYRPVRTVSKPAASRQS